MGTFAFLDQMTGIGRPYDLARVENAVQDLRRATRDDIDRAAKQMSCSTIQLAKRSSTMCLAILLISRG